MLPWHSRRQSPFPCVRRLLSSSSPHPLQPSHRWTCARRRPCGGGKGDNPADVGGWQPAPFHRCTTHSAASLLLRFAALSLSHFCLNGSLGGGKGGGGRRAARAPYPASARGNGYRETRGKKGSPFFSMLGRASLVLSPSLPSPLPLSLKRQKQDAAATCGRKAGAESGARAGRAMTRAWVLTAARGGQGRGASAHSPKLMAAVVLERPFFKGAAKCLWVALSCT